MKLSTPQLRALKKGRFGMWAHEVNANGNKLRTYLSLIKHGFMTWKLRQLVPTQKGADALRAAGVRGNIVVGVETSDGERRLDPDPES